MPTFAMPFLAVGGRDAVEFERAIEAFAREPNGGLIILPSPNKNSTELSGSGLPAFGAAIAAELA
jgi:hypothetical protein